MKSYDEILKSYLSRMSDDFDVSEGTLVYILGSVIALRLAEMYNELEILKDDVYADTATGESLERTVATLGIERNGKKAAIVKLEGDMSFPVGSVFLGGGASYKITLKENDYYLAECSVKGSEGNSYTGEVVPKEPVTDFGGMNIVSIVAPGEDEEDDESLRARYIERLNCPFCVGNMSYYKDAVKKIPGVGIFKVLAVPEGVGTVKVVITDEENRPASEELIKHVKNVLDPEETEGQGFGVVPIGHRVIVETVEEVDIDIVVQAFPETSQAGYDKFARSYIPAILRELNKTWADTDRIILWDRVIEDYYISRGAEDVNVVSINSQPNRIILEPNQILGEVTINGI